MRVWGLGMRGSREHDNSRNSVERIWGLGARGSRREHDNSRSTAERIWGLGMWGSRARRGGIMNLENLKEKLDIAGVVEELIVLAEKVFGKCDDDVKKLSKCLSQNHI